MWRIHLGTQDLAQVRLAPGADPMWELLHSLHVVTGGFGEAVFGRWRRRSARQGPAWLDALATLAPPVGYSPDFLTPFPGTTDLESGIDAVLSTPRPTLRADIARLGRSRRLPAWTGDLAAGRVASIRELGTSMNGYFQTAIAPYWCDIRRQICDEVRRATRLLATGGVDNLLGTVSPRLRWEAPVLLVEKESERDVYPEGQGLVLRPSFFAYADVTVLHVPGDPVVLAYPVRHRAGWCVARDPDASSLEPVLGRARSQALEVLAGASLTTSELAGRLGLSVPSASQHAASLRDAGLVVSDRHGKAVVHQASLLGVQLLHA